MADTDRDFDPPVEMLVNDDDDDDEQTLEEEENMSDNSYSNELSELEKESDMPLDDLIALYGVGANSSEGGVQSVGTNALRNEDVYQRSSSSGSADNDDSDSARSSSESEILENRDLTLDKEEIARDLLANNDALDDRDSAISELMSTVASSNTVRLLRSNSQPGSEESSESEEDLDYAPEEVSEHKKVIQVGSDFQAVVPEGFSHYGDTPAYENEDRLLWDPFKIDDYNLQDYLADVKQQSLAHSTEVASIPRGQHIPDDEQALYLLLQCEHNVEEAMRRRRMQAVLPSDPMSLWSEDECQNFEMGLCLYGKNFYQIQLCKVRTRSVGELVQFYYMWKKSARHDVFACKNRLEKKKYTLHPGVTDYMDRFLREQETGVLPGTLPGRDRSASPINSLMYGDSKRSAMPSRLRHVTDEAGLPAADVYSEPTVSPLVHGAFSTNSCVSHPSEPDPCVVGSSSSTTCTVYNAKKRKREIGTATSGTNDESLCGFRDDHTSHSPIRCGREAKDDECQLGSVFPVPDSLSHSQFIVDSKARDTSLLPSTAQMLNNIPSFALPSSEQFALSSEAWTQAGSSGSLGLM